MPEITYRWYVECESGHRSFGPASSYNEALQEIEDTKQLYLEQGRMPSQLAIYANEERVLSIDTFRTFDHGKRRNP